MTTQSKIRPGDRVRRTSDGRQGTIHEDCRDGWFVVRFPNDSPEDVYRTIHGDYLQPY